MLFACGWCVHGFKTKSSVSFLKCAPNVDLQNSPRANVRTYRVAPSIRTSSPTTLASITNAVLANGPSEPLGTTGNSFETRSIRNQVQTSVTMAIGLPIHVLSDTGPHRRCNIAARGDVVARRTRRSLCPSPLQPSPFGHRGPRCVPVRDGHASRYARRTRSDRQFGNPGYR